MVMDVVDRINELAAEEKCPHCDRDWHRLALTQNVARMFDAGRFDADYFTREDKSPIACGGSTFIGPPRPKQTFATGGVILDNFVGSGSLGIKFSAPWVIYHHDPAPLMKAQAAISAMYDVLISDWGSFTYKTWFSSPELEPACTGPLPDVDVEFGPQNWLPAMEVVDIPTGVQAAVIDRWHHFTKPDAIPAPTSPGYDFTAFQGDEPKYPTGKKGKRNEGIGTPRSSAR